MLVYDFSKWCVHPQDRHHVRGRQIMGKCVSDGWIYLFDLKNRNGFFFFFFFFEFGSLYFKRVIFFLFFFICPHKRGEEKFELVIFAS
jgi:hypothetical protein